MPASSYALKVYMTVGVYESSCFTFNLSTVDRFEGTRWTLSAESTNKPFWPNEYELALVSLSVLGARPYPM